MPYRDNTGLIATYLSFNSHSKNGYWQITNAGRLLEYVQGPYKEVVHYAVTLEGFDHNAKITEIKVVQIDPETIAIRDRYLREKTETEKRLRELNELIGNLPKGQLNV
jgi:hypothetical protein